MIMLLAAVVAAGQPATAARPAATTAAARPATTAAAPASKAVDPARMQAARQLVELLGVRRQLEASLAQNVAAMKSGAMLRSMLAQQPGFVPAYQADRARFDKVLAQAGAIQAGIAQKVFAANLGAAVDEATKAYARNFSTAELQGLIGFYQTPLGQALYQRQPRVAAEIGAATERVMGSKLDAAMRANASKIEAALAPLRSPPPAKK